jgi:hypothetical protein
LQDLEKKSCKILKKEEADDWQRAAWKPQNSCCKTPVNHTQGCVKLTSIKGQCRTAGRDVQKTTGDMCMQQRAAQSEKALDSRVKQGTQGHFDHNQKPQTLKRWMIYAPTPTAAALIVMMVAYH